MELFPESIILLIYLLCLNLFRKNFLNQYIHEIVPYKKKNYDIKLLKLKSHLISNQIFVTFVNKFRRVEPPDLAQFNSPFSNYLLS